MTDKLYQHSDNEFRTAVLDKQGAVIAPSNYIDAEYIIARKSGEVVLTKTLNNGITIEGSDFVTFLDDAEMTFRGTFDHQFVVYDTDGNRLPPVFKRSLSIQPTYKGN